MASVDRQRAGFALAKVLDAKTKPEKEKVLIELRKLPARLHTSGLAQSIAFYLSAGDKSAEWQICVWIAEWLRTRAIYDATGGERLMTAITSDETPYKYRRASVEARSLAVWLKRFAEAFLEQTSATVRLEQAGPDAGARA